MSISEKQLGQAIDHLAEAWLHLQTETSGAKKRELLAHEEQHTFFIHPISFLKYMILQLNNKGKPSYRKLLQESYRYQRVPTQHINDYCFGRSLKYLCMDGEFRLCNHQNPRPGNIVISSTTNTYTHINWAICGSSGQLYHINEMCDRITTSSLHEKNKLIHILELSELRLTINSNSVWSYYTSPYVRSELSEQ